VPDTLPIDALRSAFEAALDRGPVALSAPTGSGKSTQIPRWLRGRGRVLVVEPRRVACRALASRVAELERCPLGEAVGYRVRNEDRSRSNTEVLFVTTGVALRMIRDGALARFPSLVLDEFHERSLDLDLILALAMRDGRARIVVTSATLAVERVAEHLGGACLRGEGRLHPVEARHVPGRAIAPDGRGLEGRLREALRQAAGDPGDVLVFLPGKGEIAAAMSALRGVADLDLLALHGGLTLREQARVFKPGERRRVVLATNVAETSLTIPRIGVVIDSGLVRRTRYHGGRGVLTLMPIARDSAEQRAGRAGRLGPGVCYRLWRQDARMAPSTPPEIHRESLVPLVLAAAACGSHELDLPFLDPPKGFAVDAARETLRGLGALDAGDALTERGGRLFGMPVDAHLGRLLVEAEARGNLADAIALAASLATSRRLFLGRPDDPELDLRAAGCDAVARIHAVESGRPGPNLLDRQGLAEARHIARRFRRLFGLPGDGGGPPRAIDRRRLAATLLAAWPDCAHVARRRKRYVKWSNGGTELELGRETAVEPAAPDRDRVDAVLVLESRAFGESETRKRLVITAAMPAPVPWLVAAGLGRERLAGVAMERGALVARIERVYAGRVIDARSDSPAGALAREGVRDLFLRGSLFKGSLKPAKERHEAASLAARLARRPPPAPFEDWVLSRLEDLGLEEAEDLELLSGEDLMPEPLDPVEQAALDRAYPRALSIGDAVYKITYSVAKREATLHQVGGTRKDPPSDRYLPRLPGWRLLFEKKNRVRVLRERR